MSHARWLSALLVVFCLGCGGAFRDAVERGDQRAQQGQWDEAAASYERALSLEPHDEDAAARLRWARGNQAASRVAAASEHLRLGDPLGALPLLVDAERLDPHRDDAAGLLAYAVGRALDLAEHKAATGARQAALGDVSRVLAAVPGSPRALEADRHLRDEIARLSFERAASFARRGLVGNSAMELAGVLDVRPEHIEAKARFDEARRALRQRATFFAVVAPFEFSDGLGDLAEQITPQRIAEPFPSQWPLRIVAALPPEASKESAGLWLGGTLDGYDFRGERWVEPRSCTYVCERWLVDNPAHARLEAALRRAEARLSSAEAELLRREAELDRRRADLDRTEDRLDAAEQKLDGARKKLDDCRRRAKTPPDSKRCEKQEARVSKLETHQRELEKDRAEPAQRLRRAQSDQTTASSERRDADARARRERERLADTPRQIEEQRHCDYAYDVTHHRVRGAMALHSLARELHAETPITGGLVTPLHAADRDETRPAHPDRCAAIAREDALDLASESQIRSSLTEAAIATLRQRILGAYEAERARVGSDAERAAADGDLERAVELWVRFVTTRRGSTPTDEAAMQRIAAARGVSLRAVRHALDWAIDQPRPVEP